MQASYSPNCSSNVLLLTFFFPNTLCFPAAFLVVPKNILKCTGKVCILFDNQQFSAFTQYLTGRRSISLSCYSTSAVSLCLLLDLFRKSKYTHSSEKSQLTEAVLMKCYYHNVRYQAGKYHRFLSAFLNFIKMT